MADNSTSSSSVAQLVIGVSAMFVLTGCVTEAEDTTDRAPGPATSSTTPEPKDAAIVDVNPDDYAIGQDYYRWRLTSDHPMHICTIFPLQTDIAGVECTVPLRADTPSSAGPPIDGQPNAVNITAGGVGTTIAEQPSRTPKTLPARHRITVDDVTCTSLTEQAFHCTKNTDAFVYDNGTLTVSDSDAARAAPTSTSVPKTG